MQTTGIQERLFSKVKSVNHSAYYDTHDKTPNFSFSSSTVWGSVLYVLSFRSLHKKITAVVYMSEEYDSQEQLQPRH